MKVIVFGGAGRVGRRIVSELSMLGTNPDEATTPPLLQDVEIVVADRDSSDLAGVPWVELNLAEPRSVAAALHGVDLVVNAIGPYDQWGTLVLDAAIEAGVDYVDVCDDPAATRRLLDRDEAARGAGIRAVIGMGVSPGLTNFLAVKAARELDQVDLLVTFWGYPEEGLDPVAAKAQAMGMAGAFESGRAAYVHLMEQASAQVPIWRGGRPVQERAWRQAYRVTTSGGHTGIFRLVGHPEPVTLPTVLEVQDCLNVGTTGAGLDRLMLPVLDEVAAGVTSPQEALKAIAGELRAIPTALCLPALGPELPRIVGAAAVGAKGNKPDGVIAFPAGPIDGSMSLETARPAVVAISMIENAPIGANAPEAAFDADDYLARYSACYWGGGDPVQLDWAGYKAVVQTEGP